MMSQNNIQTWFQKTETLSDTARKYEIKNLFSKSLEKFQKQWSCLLFGRMDFPCGHRNLEKEHHLNWKSNY